MTKEQAEFPTVAGPEHAIKLPGQTRVSPEEYKAGLAFCCCCLHDAFCSMNIIEGVKSVEQLYMGLSMVEVFRGW